MRVWDLALFLMIFNAIAGMMLALIGGVIPGGFGAVESKTSILNTTDSVTNSITTASNQGVSIQAVFSWFNVAFQLLLLIIPLIFSMISGILLGTFLILTNVGVPGIVAAFIQLMVWVIFAVGIQQYVAGRSFREYE